MPRIVLPSRTDLADNEFFKAEPRYITTAKAVGIGQVPWVFHFNDMVNSDASPWIGMLQTAIFDGKIDEAINEPGEDEGNLQRVGFLPTWGRGAAPRAASRPSSLADSGGRAEN